MSTPSADRERLVSADSHVHFTDDWVKARLSARLAPRWDEAVEKQGEFDAKELRAGQPNLALEDFVDMNAAMDPATSSRTASSRRWTATASRPR